MPRVKGGTVTRQRRKTRIKNWQKGIMVRNGRYLKQPNSK